MPRMDSLKLTSEPNWTTCITETLSQFGCAGLIMAAIRLRGRGVLSSKPELAMVIAVARAFRHRPSEQCKPSQNPAETSALNSLIVYFSRFDKEVGDCLIGVETVFFPPARSEKVET